jgi:hypothetical protein
MQDLGDKLSQLNQEAQRAKTKMKEEGGNLERLRAERAEVERELERVGLQSEDNEKFVPLYDWYAVTSLSVLSKAEISNTLGTRHRWPSTEPSPPSLRPIRSPKTSSV